VGDASGSVTSTGAGRAAPPVPADQGAWGYAYGASKAAMARLAGCINVEYGAKGVRAFSVNPGLVSTEAVTATLGDGGLLEQRYGAMKPQAIAAGLVWLATDPRAAALAADPMMIDLHFHDLRHEATSRLAEKLEMHELMKVTGHKSSAMLARYYHPGAEDLAQKLG